MFFLRFFKDFWLGIKASVQATQFVFKHGLWPYFFFSAFVAALVVWLGVLNHDGIMQFRIPEEIRGNLPELTLAVAIWLGKLLLLLMAVSLNKYIILIVLPPILVKISEKTERIVTGNTYKFSAAQFWKDIKRSVRIVLDNFAWEAGLILVGMIIFAIFNVPAIVTPIYIFFVGIYFYGFSMMDYTSERRRLNIIDSKKFIRKHAGMAVGIGLVYSSMIVFLKVDFGWFPGVFGGAWLDVKLYFGVIFAPVICVTAATLGVHGLVDLSKNEFAIHGDQPEEAEETE
jgi:CysZ protein